MFAINIGTLQLRTVLCLKITFIRHILTPQMQEYLEFQKRQHGSSAPFVAIFYKCSQHSQRLPFDVTVLTHLVINFICIVR